MQSEPNSKKTDFTFQFSSLLNKIHIFAYHFYNLKNMDIALILACLDLAKSIASFLKLCESIDSKIDRLLNCDLGAGITALNHAVNSRSQEFFYIREAWHSFNRATNLEKDERLILAYIGLALCNTYLNEKENAKQCLHYALEVKNSGNGFIANNTFLSFFPGVIGPGTRIYSIQYNNRERRLNSLKADINNYLQGT